MKARSWLFRGVRRRPSGCRTGFGEGEEGVGGVAAACTAKVSAVLAMVAAALALLPAPGRHLSRPRRSSTAQPAGSGRPSTSWRRARSSARASTRPAPGSSVPTASPAWLTLAQDGYAGLEHSLPISPSTAMSCGWAPSAGWLRHEERPALRGGHAHGGVAPPTAAADAVVVARGAARGAPAARPVAAASRHMPTPACHVPTPACHVPIPACHVPIPACHVPIPACRTVP